MQGFPTSSKTTGTLTILQKHLCKLSHDQKKIFIILFHLSLHGKSCQHSASSKKVQSAMTRERRSQSGGLLTLQVFTYPRDNGDLVTLSFQRRLLLVITLSSKKMGMHQRKASRQKLYIAFNPQRPEQALTAGQVLDLVSRILKWLPENLNWVLSRVRAGPLLPITQQSQIAFWYARGDTSLRHPRKAWQRKLRVHTMHRHTHHRLVGVTPACMDYPSDNIEHSKVCWENIRQLLSVRRPHTRA